ncbi:MAG: c-type cytochrome [Chitinophagaceae bacterium]|nr:c-type cytochrome [Chitinophagaceae bacterium]
MLSRHQLITCAGIIVFVVLGIAATRLPEGKPRNLKVLPADISDQMLDSIMNTYNKALGVSCDFCHSKHKTIPDALDFADDGVKMKSEARKMMRLTIQINKDYFYYDTTRRPEYLKVVTCNTCHRGDPFPADL